MHCRKHVEHCASQDPWRQICSEVKIVWNLSCFLWKQIDLSSKGFSVWCIHKPVCDRWEWSDGAPLASTEEIDSSKQLDYFLLTELGLDLGLLFEHPSWLGLGLVEHLLPVRPLPY